MWTRRAETQAGFRALLGKTRARLVGSPKTEHQAKADQALGAVEGVVADLKRCKDAVLRRFEARKETGSGLRLRFLDLEKLNRECRGPTVLEKLQNRQRGLEKKRGSLATSNLEMGKGEAAVTKATLLGGNGGLESGEFEALLCEMLTPLVFVERLEGLGESAVSVLFLLKVKSLCEELLHKNEDLRRVTGMLVELGECERWANQRSEGRAGQSVCERTAQGTRRRRGRRGQPGAGGGAAQRGAGGGVRPERGGGGKGGSGRRGAGSAGGAEVGEGGHFEVVPGN